MKMSKIYLTSVLGLDFDLDLLPHFVEHYLDLGIKPENFLLVLNCFKYPENLQKAIQVLENYGIKPKDLWTSEYESEEKWRRVNHVLSTNILKEDWVVHPDFDEFHVFPKSLNDVILEFEEKGINAVQGILLDRVSKDKKVKNITKEPSVWQQFPLETCFSKLLKLGGVKLMLYKGYLRANNGSAKVHDKFQNIVKYPYGNKSLHRFKQIKYLVGDSEDKNRAFVAGEYEMKTKEWEEVKQKFGYIVYHFKWTGNVIEKLEQRYDTYTRLRRAQAFQSKNWLDFYRNNGEMLI